MKIRAWTLFKEWTLSVFLAVQLHLCLSLGLSFKYGMDQIFSVAIGAVVAALIVMMVVFVVKPKNFGDYKSFFRGGIRSNVYIIVVVCRLVIAFSLSAFENPNLCLTASISVMPLLFIRILVFKPYK